MSIIGRSCGFMMPAASLADPYFSSVKLLLHGDGADEGTVFTDSSSAAKTATLVGTTRTEQSVQKFGTASLKFQSVGDGLSYTNADADLIFGTGDFTVEWWMKYPTAISNGGNVFSTGAGANLIVSLGTAGIGGTIGKLNVYTSGTNLISTTSLDTNTWHFVAISRVGTTFNLYVNGTREDTQTNSVNLSTGQMKLGGAGYHSIVVTSYLDDFRVTKGVGRYTGATCAVPTAAFPDS